MKESQAQVASAVIDGHKPTATATIAEGRIHHLALHQALLLWVDVAKRDHAAAILVAERQVKQQVADPENAQALELPLQAGPDAFQGFHALLGDHGAFRLRALTNQPSPGWAMTPSTSTAAPRGRAATPIAARAGYGSLK